MSTANTQTTEYTIDASGRSVGRVATEVADILRGKNAPQFAPHKIANVQVKIVNTAKADIPASKRSQKTYHRYSGYPGGLKEMRMEELITQKGYSEVFRNAIYGMLPANKLRKQMLKNLIITE